MQRREFLRRTGAVGTAALAAAAGPPSVHTSDKSGTRNAVIGRGEHRYECVHGWGALSDHIQCEEPFTVIVSLMPGLYDTAP
jgi:hypothetical protein